MQRTVFYCQLPHGRLTTVDGFTAILAEACPQVHPTSSTIDRSKLTLKPRNNCQTDFNTTPVTSAHNSLECAFNVLSQRHQARSPCG